LLVAGCWLLVAGCWLLVAGCWLLVAGCWLLVAGCWENGDAGKGALQAKRPLSISFFDFYQPPATSNH
jgi:high-affinity Fe2+/Pb2+ permease